VSIGWVGLGALAFGATSADVPFPAGSAGDLVLILAASGETGSATPTSALGAMLATSSGPAGTYGNNAGARRSTVFWFEASDGASGTATVSIGGSSTGRVVIGQAMRLSKAASEAWDVSGVSGGSDTATDASVVLTEASALGYTTGDWIVAHDAVAQDISNPTGEALSGGTFDAPNRRSEEENNTGNDVKHTIVTATATADATGPVTLTQSWDANTGAAGTFVRVHVTSSPDTGTYKLLEVVGSISGIDADASGKAIYDRYVASPDYAVTLWEAGTPAPDLSAYDVVWLTNSCPSAMSMTGYDTTTTPVIASGVRSPHSGYAGGLATDGPTQTFVHLKSAGVGDPTVPPEFTTEADITILDTAFNTRYVLDTLLGAGQHQIACVDSADLNHLTFTRYDAGDTMDTGTAPSKRAWFLTHPGSMGANTNGWGFMDALLAWATSTSESHSGGSTASVVVTASGGGTKHASGGSTASVSATASGGGTKASSGGGTTGVVASASGGGAKTASGGSATAVVVATSGGGAKSGAGGSAATVDVTTSGGGSKASFGASTASVVVSATGGGLTYRFGGSTAGVVVTATGGGHANEAGQGGSTATVVVTSSGGGAKHARGGSTTLVQVLASCGWFKPDNPSGGSTAVVEVTTTGGGSKHAAGGSTTSVVASAFGGGHNLASQLVTPPQRVTRVPGVRPAMVAAPPRTFVPSRRRVVVVDKE
jgi:hypothetical protein